MKKSLRNLILIATVTILLVSIGICSYATNPEIMPRVNTEASTTDEENGIMPISENEGTSISSKDVIHENVYRASTDSKLEITDDIYGNVFLAGNEIIVSSDMIRGDLFIAGNNITIAENTVVNGNLYIAGQEMTINGTCYRSAYIAGKTINLGDKSVIDYDVFLAAEKISVDGDLGRNAHVYSGKLEVSDTASVAGNLVYEANEQAKIPEGVVKGTVDFKKIVEEKETTTDLILRYVKDLVQSLVFTLVVFLIVSLMSNKFIYKSQELFGKHPLRSIGIGLFGLIFIPIITLMLLLFGPSSTVGIAMIPTFILLIMLANSITAIAISGMICSRSKGMKLWILVPLITIALWAIESIPYIGLLASFAAMLMGIGILLQCVFTGNKTISKGEEKVKEEKATK